MSRYEQDSLPGIDEQLMSQYDLDSLPSNDEQFDDTAKNLEAEHLERIERIKKAIGGLPFDTDLFVIHELIRSYNNAIIITERELVDVTN